MSKNCKCGEIIKNKKRSKCDDCRNGRRGLKFSEMILIAESQGMKCPILGTEFRIVENKILDMNEGKRYKKKPQSVCVDHDHSSNHIRGLLSDMGNMLVGGFDRGEYGDLDRPKKMQDYLEKKYAFNIVGIREFIK